MKRLMVLFGFVVLLALPAKAEDARALFEKGNALARAGNHAAALDLYKQALALEPERPVLLYNAGISAFLSGNAVEALGFFQRYRKVEPTDWRGLTKVIQCAQAVGDEPTVDAGIIELKAWWKRGDNADLSRQKHFVRDQWVDGSDRVLVIEPFEQPTGKLQRIWEFIVFGADEKPRRVYYVELDAASTELARSQGQKDAELYFYDMDEPGRHVSFGSVNGRPLYKQAVAHVKDIMAGKVAPVSSTTRDK